MFSEITQNLNYAAVTLDPIDNIGDEIEGIRACNSKDEEHKVMVVAKDQH